MGQWVPSEPTEEMISVGLSMWNGQGPAPTMAEIYKAMLAAAPSPWQLIETAPKDGSWVLLSRDGTAECWLMAQWTISQGRHTWRWLSIDGSEDGQEPTHWAPMIPPLPNQNKEES